MITKIIFTMVIIVIVGILFSKQQRSSSGASAKSATSATPRGSFSPAQLAYSLVALLIVVSGVIAFFGRSEANEIITLDVYGASGAHTQYQAYQKNINGRTFTTIDNRQVQLAETDRLEIITQ